MYINVYRICEIYFIGVKFVMFVGLFLFFLNWMFLRWSIEVIIENKV